MSSATETEAATIASIARSSVAPTKMSDPANTDLVIFADKQIKSLEVFADRPRRKRATVSLYEAASFIDYVKAHKLIGGTHLFGHSNEKGGSFCAIIDYHATNIPGGVVGDANWADHFVNLALLPTPEWNRWIENNEQIMSQEKFAEFLEDNLNDIVNPVAADLLEIAQLLTGKKGVTFKSGRSLRTGMIDFQYSEEIAVGGGRTNESMEVPSTFTLGICPFVGANGVELTARLRFRISDSGKLSFMYLLNQPHKVVEEAFSAIRKDIEEATQLKVHLGSAQIQNPRQ